MIPFKNILVPVDFSEPSDHALTVAIQLAKQNDAALTLVHVFDTPPVYAGMDMSPMDLLTPMVEAAQRQLDATLEEVRREVPNAKIIMAQGAPWRQLLEAIAQAKADLVVMGTHGRHGLGRLILGSVAEKVVRLSPVPVLTIRGRAETVPETRAA